MKYMQAVIGCLTALAVLVLGCTVTTTLSAKAESITAIASTPQQKKTPPASKVVPHPEDWITLADDRKGYSFDVPKGTEYSTEKSNGIDVFLASTPEPTGVGIVVMAFKDPKLKKDDLINFAVGGLEGLGAKKIKVGTLTELSADYSLATYTAINEEGNPVRGKVLVATDVTDNYVMIVGAEESEYKANEKTIDEIWGSFSMRSGGASGKS
jgi:hypothetical protein